MSNLSYTIKFEDNTSKIEVEAENAIERALYAIGVKAVEGSVEAISGNYSIDSAVDTGRLRASISFITAGGKEGKSTVGSTNSKNGDTISGTADKNSVIVGTNVEYAEYVHNGTSRMNGRPFIREGIEQTKDEMENQVKMIFEGKL